MEYERIHRIETGVVSPSKLKMMKVAGPHHHKKDGSRTNSARTSPSKLDDSEEFVNNKLLASTDFVNEDLSSKNISTDVVLDSGLGDPDHTEIHQFSRKDCCDSSGLLQTSVARSVSKSMPSKWNNADKWIMNKHNPNCSKKTGVVPGLGGQFPVINSVTVDEVEDFQRVELCQQPSLQTAMEKFSFVPPSIYPFLSQENEATALIDLKEVVHTDVPCTKSSCENMNSALPAIRSVAMRDMGTEMTPLSSRTETPVEPTTPEHSPHSSLPRTPRCRALADHLMEDNSKMKLSEEELKQKTRREILELGVQLGKLNIAEWASKGEEEHHHRSPRDTNTVKGDVIIQIENKKRAEAWEEAENSKHLARYRREEIKIEAWESQQKAKIDAEMRRVEVQMEQLKTKGHAKAMKKMAKATQKCVEKRAVAEAKRKEKEERTAAQAEYISRTGKIPPSKFFCCDWF